MPPAATAYVADLPTGVKGTSPDLSVGTPQVPDGGSITTGTNWSYNYTAMVNYVEQYWDTYNPSYRSFGNDCTNFMSQALKVGGWDFDYGWYRSSGNWWYNSSNQTYTWAGAENWSKFAPKRSYTMDSIWKMVPSDIMQMDFDRNGVMNHGMMVTYRMSDGSNLYITQHTTDYHNRSVRTILYFYPNALYYAWRT